MSLSEKLQKYTIRPIAVIAVSRKLTQGSWHTMVVFLVELIGADMEVGTLCKAIAATRVFHFFCFITTLIMGSSNQMLVMTKQKVSTLKVLVSQNSTFGWLRPLSGRIGPKVLLNCK